MDRDRRIRQYREHLASEHWAAIKRAAHGRAGGRCEHCGEVIENFHHVRYPKQFRDDAVHNVVALCRRCHELHHGIRDMSAIGELDGFVYEGRSIPTWHESSLWHVSYPHVYMVAYNLEFQDLKTTHHQESMRAIWAGLPDKWKRRADYPTIGYLWIVGRDGLHGCVARMPTPEGNRLLVALVEHFNESSRELSVGDALIATGKKLNDHEQRITALEQRETVAVLPAPETCTILVRCKHLQIATTMGERNLLGREVRRLCLLRDINPDQFEHVAHGSEPGKEWPIYLVDEALKNKGFL